MKSGSRELQVAGQAPYRTWGICPTESWGTERSCTGQMPHEDGVAVSEDGLSAQGAEAREQLLLLAHLDDVLHQLGAAGAVDLLGVDRKTLWRATQSGRVDGVLRKALLRHAEAESEATNTACLKRLEALEAAVQQITDTVRQGTERLARLEEEGKAGATERRSAATRLSEAERTLITLSSRPGEFVQGIAQERNLQEVAPETEGDALKPQTAGDRDSSGAEMNPEVVKLQEERDLARAARDSARTKMDQVAASERVLEAELALIQTHGLTLPPGEEWSRVRRSDEISWRWRALEQARTERRRLERRRWLRRVLTLGLWWR